MACVDGSYRIWKTGMKRDWKALFELFAFSSYDEKALIKIHELGVADAAKLCREAGIPTSKIYQSMEKLAELELVDIHAGWPKLFVAKSTADTMAQVERLVERHQQTMRQHLHAFHETLAGLPAQLGGKTLHIDVAQGPQAYVKRHLTRLAGARETVISYMEYGDLQAIEQTAQSGFPVLRRINQNTMSQDVRQRAIFGFHPRNAAVLHGFLRTMGDQLSACRGVRYCGEMGYPFHVYDGEYIILALDHPFIPGGRFVSLFLQDKSLVTELVTGFDKLWDESLQEFRQLRFMGTMGPSS